MYLYSTTVEFFCREYSVIAQHHTLVAFLSNNSTDFLETKKAIMNGDILKNIQANHLLHSSFAYRIMYHEIQNL